MICSIFHRSVEETAFCFCASIMLILYDVHCRRALASIEDVIPRVKASRARTCTHKVTCPNPALHTVHQEVDLHPRLQ